MWILRGARACRSDSMLHRHTSPLLARWGTGAFRGLQLSAQVVVLQDGQSGGQEMSSDIAEMRMRN
eukprot:CAMPEP_0172167122 /NCGR_PEP_ID=MMETSP1050-20130122/9389_1 /TAXON_ID=233186 /ORGANISM="Cryptomonas curvata, Strain CCAP979/52" /LENGTH=65 /DNA_ID=CAMNT_0012837863 /DNA_START=132 /DNA_END=329 /DNA_ORIENTATION=+